MSKLGSFFRPSGNAYSLWSQHMISWSSGIELAPYLGLYGDYYFSGDDASVVGLTTVPLSQGWSARATGGFAATFANGARLGAGGEFGGFSGAGHIWTMSVRGSCRSDMRCSCAQRPCAKAGVGGSFFTGLRN
jgi:hypothetical protein